jgi:hypothetical protein
MRLGGPLPLAAGRPRLALRRRIDPAPPNTSKSPGLSRLLQTAIEKGYLKRADFGAIAVR